MNPSSRRYLDVVDISVELLKSNILGIFTEALTRYVQAIFSDNSMLVASDAAVKTQ